MFDLYQCVGIINWCGEEGVNYGIEGKYSGDVNYLLVCFNDGVD